MMFKKYSERRGLVEAYDYLVADRRAQGWRPYFIKFMFKKIPAKKSTKFEIMKKEVMRVYLTLLPHVVRKPTGSCSSQYNPILIGCPDNRVLKRERTQLAGDHVVNDGWHFNAVLLLPPENVSGFREHLANHLNTGAGYLRPDAPLQRTYAIFVTEGTVIDYALKHFKRGNVSYDDILILPRAISELSERSRLRKRETDLVNDHAASVAASEMKSMEEECKMGKSSKIHRGYELVAKLDRLWEIETGSFDPYYDDEGTMSDDQVRNLIRAFKKIRKECWSAIKELRALPDQD